ncbi:hypothetical protein P7K49_032058 [Saguinus oedipus]|uniref:Uncharacterized protein n=1 Tax=Saguinus oedipus TaxID=9490 RepID=A0ABQ9TZ15_SAGOE|nr:hypothetical protein P7K49_032058 [Saguinus oedipus]
MKGKKKKDVKTQATKKPSKPRRIQPSRHSASQPHAGTEEARGRDAEEPRDSTAPPCRSSRPGWQHSGDTPSISGSGEVGVEGVSLAESVGGSVFHPVFLSRPLLPRQCGAQQCGVGPGLSRQALLTRLTFVASCDRAGPVGLGVQAAFIPGAHWAPPRFCRILCIPSPLCAAVPPMPSAWTESGATAAQGRLQQKGLTGLQDLGAPQGRTKEPRPARSHSSHRGAWPGRPRGQGHAAPGRYSLSGDLGPVHTKADLLLPAGTRPSLPCP